MNHLIVIEKGVWTEVVDGLPANLSWTDISWVKSLAPEIPIIIKGIGCVDDVAKAFEHGASGVILSNHGVSLLSD